MAPSVPLTRPSSSAHELEYVTLALSGGPSPNGASFIAAAQKEVARRCGVPQALLTPSCTAALEMAAMLCRIEPRDEVVMPSYTFVSTANAVVLRGGVPVFVDIRPDTLNIDEGIVEAAITPRTRAIFAVHYAGICAEMDALREIANRRGIMLVEDAAQAYGSTYRGRPAGSLADMGCISFHYTKNVVCGEGGALTLPPGADSFRAGVIWEKGTNRKAFMDGLADKYTWVDIGSSYTPSELNAAWLLGQLEDAQRINGERLAVWNQYHSGLAELEARIPGLRRPIVPSHCQHNGHIYYLLAPDEAARRGLIASLHRAGFGAAFHYVPLHSSPAGGQFTRVAGSMSVTEDTAARLVRLPLFAGMGSDVVDEVISQVELYFDRQAL